MDRRQARAGASRLAQLHDGLTEPALLLERQAKVVARFGMARLEPRRGLQSDERAVEVFRPPPRRAEVILRVEQPGIDQDCLFELTNRLLRLTLLTSHEAQAVVGLGHARAYSIALAYAPAAAAKSF